MTRHFSLAAHTAAVFIFAGLSAAAIGAQQPAKEGPPTPTRCDAQSDRFSTDSIVGIGQVLFAGGNVVIHCPDRGITLHGDSAQRYPDRDVMIGHAVYDEPRFHVTSDFLNYFPANERIVAAGNVHGTMPSGSKLDGPQAEYLRAAPKIRTKPEMNAIARPTITIAERDSLGRPMDPTIVVANTVHMVGDSASLIYGGGQVVITRPDLTATGDSAFIDEGAETMRLMRNPKVVGKKDRPFTLTGDLIDAFSKNRKLERVISRSNAVAVSDSMTLKSDTIDLRIKNDLLDHAYAWGAKSRARAVSPSQNLTADSLDVFMPNQHVSLVRALRTALAEGRPDTVKFQVQKPDTLDWLKGDTIVAHFDTLPAKDTSKAPPIRQLVSSGHAASYYHMAPSDTSAHRPAINYVTARLITVDFNHEANRQQVSTVTTTDSVTGVFIEPKADTTAKRTNAQNGTKGQPTSIVPLPPPKSRPPTRPPLHP